MVGGREQGEDFEKTDRVRKMEVEVGRESAAFL
jgi:hypothetical protein